MPIQTDTTVSPYFDDYDALKDYYKTLFKPGVPVQVRELNQLQTVIQKQIERLGDNLYKRGTVIDGCDITFHTYFPYVKILDSENDGSPVNVAQYQDYYLKNSANLQAIVIKTQTGFEATAPDLNTLFIRYINSGTDSNTSIFAADQTLTVFNANNIIEKVTITAASAGFSNTNSVAFVSAIAVQNTIGGQTVGFSNGDIIDNGSGANVQIIGLDTSTNTQVTYLQVKPLTVDLNVTSANTAKWSFANGDTVSNTGVTATVVSTVGSGAAASIVTGSAGEIDTVSVTSKGSGYFILPHVTVVSASANTTQISALQLTPQNFLTTITVGGSATTPVGSGYGATIGEGVIYQKGFFTRVDKQLVVISKYSNTPDSLALGFSTNESIINSNIDTSLLDNALGSPNYTAPGADRLKLVPTGTVISSTNAASDPEFLTIVEFSNGLPYKQNIKTKFNILGDEIARRTFEESGNYVLDQFSLSTKDSANLNATQNTISVTIDPGLAYINGQRVETLRNFNTSVDKGTDTASTTGVTISMDYGNYVRVKELAGGFNFAIGDYIKLYDTAQTYLTDSVGATISMTGNQIGTARIRSLVLDEGTPGTPGTTYRLYLFDIQMNTGKNFSAVRSVYYDNGTYDGVADIALEADPTSGANVALLKDSNRSGLVFYTGIAAIKDANTIAYTYRNYRTDQQIASNGTLTFSTSANEVFPYTGTLSSTQVKDIIISPVANAVSTTTLTGTVSTTNATTTTVTGSATAFTTELTVGDYIKISGAASPVRVTAIANSTSLTTHSAPGSVSANTLVLSYPAGIPIDLTRSGRSAVVAANTTSMTIDIGNTISGAATVNLTYNIRATDVSPASKTVQRDRFVRIFGNTHPDLNNGPWCLGTADVFRLKGVYKGSNNTFSDTDAGVTDVTNDYYIDMNHTEDYYGLAYLYRKDTAISSFNDTTDRLLVKFDYFTTATEGLKAKPSYPISDNTALASAASTIHTLEIPEFYGIRGDYFDLRDEFDLRPFAANTVTANTTASNAPVNPSESSALTRFNSTNKKFPAPDSTVSATLEYYRGRIDRVIIDEEGTIAVLRGAPDAETAPQQPSNSLTINLLNIPPYPTIPTALSTDLLTITDTKVANERYVGKRLARYSVTVPLNAGLKARQQPRGYTMEQIGDLERRISDLEYYVSFTLAEALVKNRTIPSSVTPSVDRFKFGFFVDNFDDTSYSDITNPRYNASISGGKLCPAGELLNLVFEPSPDHANTQSLVTNNSLQFAYSESTLFTQFLATAAAVANTGTGVSPPPPPAPPETITYDGSFLTIAPPNFTVNITGSAIDVGTETSPSGNYTNAAFIAGSQWDGIPNSAEFVVTPEPFVINAVGLKPNTKHLFLYDGIDYSTRCEQTGKTLGEDLITDSNGTLEFTFYLSVYNPDPSVPIDANTAATDYVQSSLENAAGASIKNIQLKDSANTSTADGVIYPPVYADVSAPPPPPPPPPSPSPENAQGNCKRTGPAGLKCYGGGSPNDNISIQAR